MCIPSRKVNHITRQEHIRELHELLVQTCVDFINKHGLSDIYDIQFQASDLGTSAKTGKWSAETDSSLTVEGLRNIDGLEARYEIGTSM